MNRGQAMGCLFEDVERQRLVEPLLADEALVLIDDASWPVVQKAHRLFLKRHPGWQIVEQWDAAHADDPRWANGLHALTFRRVPGTARKLSGTDEALRRYYDSADSFPQDVAELLHYFDPAQPGQSVAGSAVEEETSSSTNAPSTSAAPAASSEARSSTDSKCR